MFEVLQDYRDYPNGGDGWLRLIEFDIDFASRLDPVLIPKAPVDPGATPTFAFQQGRNGYNGTLDKEIRSSGGDSSNGDATEISVDGDDGSPGAQPNQALVRFDAIIGAAPGQIPTGAKFEKALLTLEVTNEGSGFTVHEMLAGWDESSTWQSLGSGVQADGVEASSAAIATLGANNSGSNVGVGTLEIDVTESVRAWLNGDSDNLGWVLSPFVNGTNGVDFFTSEFADPSTRPSLQIFTAPGDYNLDGVVDGADHDVWRAAYGTEGASLADGNRDGVVDAADYSLWRDAAAAAALSIPEPSSDLLAFAATVVATRRGAARR